MRALLTGVSSFTGCWFGAALAEAGWHVVGTCRQPLDAYPEISLRRLAHARRAGCELVEETAFGDERFQQIVATGRFDLLCHHGVEVGNFRREDYDPVAVLSAATLHADRALRFFAEGGGRAILVTGSVFEPESTGSRLGAAAANGYGLAKRLIWDTLHHLAGELGLNAARFVVAHPFGPFDKPGLVEHLLRTWLSGRPASIDHPSLVRDFLHVDFLAAAYAGFCAEQLRPQPRPCLAPSGRVGTLLAQAQRLSAEMAPRLGVACAVASPARPSAGSEPLIRINADPMFELAASWPFGRSWDRLAEFYL